MQLHNPLLFCRYQPINDTIDLKKMVLNKTSKIVRIKSEWNIKKGMAVKIPSQDIQWLSNSSFNTSYGYFEIREKYKVPFNEIGFNYKKFFKGKNICLTWEERTINNGTITSIEYGARITWNNRKGFVYKRSKNEQTEVRPHEQGGNKRKNDISLEQE